MTELAIVLLTAHCLGDFLLQPTGLARRKGQFGFLALHALIHAALAYLLLQQWSLWQLPATVLVIHGLIDWIKQRSGSDSATAFAVDQGAHFAVTLALVAGMSRLGWLASYGGIDLRPLIVIAGWAAAARGSGLFIGHFARRIVERNGIREDIEGGLQDGGQLIGQLERTLIFLFIVVGRPEGIGFLVAAKSILRYEESKKQKLAEYVLLGTLLSFSLAIALATVTRWAVGRFA